MSEGREPAHAGPTSLPTFHVHPLQQCNLSCLHCYSDSSSSATAQLTLTQLESAVYQAAEWGYRVMSVSGGEPLMYPQLRRLLEMGHDCGMTTAVVTNGLLFQRSGALEALQLADAVAVSVDGMSESHDRLRGRHRAFAKTLTALAVLRANGIPFAITCGITPQNIFELDELAQAVLDSGAGALQLHPVELAGRAKLAAEDMVLDGEAAVAFFVLANLLKVEYSGRLAISVDAVHRVTALAQPQMLYAQPAPILEGRSNLADNVGVLVLDPFGNLMPVSYGFAKPLWIGNLAEDLRRLGCEYLAESGGVHELYALGCRAFEEVRQGRGPDVFNPSDILAQASHAALFQTGGVLWPE